MVNKKLTCKNHKKRKEMQIIIFVLVLIILGAVVYQKLRRRYAASQILLGTAIISVLFIGSIYIFNMNEGGIKAAFKSKYKEIYGNEISKLSASIMQSKKGLEANEYFYRFVYITIKDKKEYVCEAKNVFVQLIEDEYVFKEIKEECREK